MIPPSLVGITNGTCKEPGLRRHFSKNLVTSHQEEGRAVPGEVPCEHRGNVGGPNGVGFLESGCDQRLESIVWLRGRGSPLWREAASMRPDPL